MSALPAGLPRQDDAPNAPEIVAVPAPGSIVQITGLAFEDADNRDYHPSNQFIGCAAHVVHSYPDGRGPLAGSITVQVQTHEVTLVLACSALTCQYLNRWRLL